MITTHAEEPSQVAPAVPDEPTFASIGRLVRACAEIEDLLTLHISRLAETSESRLVVLLGQTGISRRIEIAKYLAQLSCDAAVSDHQEAFGADLREILNCRNAVAHGVLLGKAGMGHLAFLTSKTVAPTSDAARQVVVSYLPDNIATFAIAAERAIPKIEQKLQLQELRQSRYAKPLTPHPKASRLNAELSQLPQAPQSDQDGID